MSCSGSVPLLLLERTSHGDQIFKRRPALSEPALFRQGVAGDRTHALFDPHHGRSCCATAANSNGMATAGRTSPRARAERRRSTQPGPSPHAQSACGDRARYCCCCCDAFTQTSQIGSCGSGHDRRQQRAISRPDVSTSRTERRGPTFSASARATGTMSFVSSTNNRCKHDARRYARIPPTSQHSASRRRALRTSLRSHCAPRMDMPLASTSHARCGSCCA